MLQQKPGMKGHILYYSIHTKYFERSTETKSRLEVTWDWGEGNGEFLLQNFCQGDEKVLETVMVTEQYKYN